MKGRQTLVMGLLFALFALGVWYLEFERAPEPAEEESAEVALLPGNDWDTLRRIELESPAAGGTLVLERELASEEDPGPFPWRIVAPIESAADDAAVAALLGALEGLEGEPVARLAEEGAEPFGLDRATVRARLVFDVAGGKGRIERVVVVGDGTPVGYQVYVHVEGQPEVHITPSYLRSALDKSVFDLRRKKLVEFAAPDVRGLTLERAGEQIALERGGEGWGIVLPVRARARTDAVDDLVDGLTALRASSFEAVDPGEGAPGFDAPELAVTVELDAEHGSKRSRLAFAADPDAPAELRVLRGEGAPVARIRKPSFARLDKKLDDLRDRVLVRFDRDAVARVEIAVDGSGLALVRALPEGEDGELGPWSLDGDPDGVVDQGNVNQMLIALGALEAAAFVDAAGDDVMATLDRAEAEIRLLGGAGEELGRLAVAAADAAQPDGTRLARGSAQAAPVRMPDGFLDDVPRGAADLVPPEPEPAAGPEEPADEASPEL